MPRHPAGRQVSLPHPDVCFKEETPCIHSLSCYPVSSPRRWTDLPGRRIRLLFFSWVRLTSPGPRVQGVWPLFPPAWAGVVTPKRTLFRGSHSHPTLPLLMVMLAVHLPSALPSSLSGSVPRGQWRWLSYQQSSPKACPSPGKNEKTKPEKLTTPA